MENTDFKAITGLLSSSRNILITTHTNPDGDAIGSSLALGTYLTKKGHRVEYLIPDPYPGFLSWMEGIVKIHIYSHDPEKCTRIVSQADLIIAADYNNLSRLNEAGLLVKNSKVVKVLIDHHLYPSDEFLYKISNPHTSSTSELVYDFISASDDLHLIDRPIAEYLYTGIITDTGSLSYSCNYVKTYQIIAELFRLGIDGEHLHRLIYDTYSEKRLRLLGFSISDSLIVLPEYHTAYITLRGEDLDRFDYQVGDTEGVVNYALSIKDINLAALFMQRDGFVKVSFRSKGKFSVDRIAREHFDGGGHSNASGANVYSTIDETVQRFLNLLPGYQEQLKSVY